MSCVRKLLGKCLRVLDSLDSDNFSNSSLDVRLLLVTVLLYLSLETFPHSHPFIQGLTLSIANAPKGTAQSGPGGKGQPVWSRPTSGKGEQ